VNHKQIIFRNHLVPQLGSKRLDAITNEDVQRLKHRLQNKAVWTVNNVLSVLGITLRKGRTLRKPEDQRPAHPASHVLFASGDARGANESHPEACRAS
jgi:hypothetical protein